MSESTLLVLGASSLIALLGSVLPLIKQFIKGRKEAIELKHASVSEEDLIKMLSVIEEIKKIQNQGLISEEEGQRLINSVVEKSLKEFETTVSSFTKNAPLEARNE